MLSLAEVVAEVIIAWRFWDDWGTVRYRNVFEVQEAEFNLHRQQDFQLAAHGFAAHLPAQEYTKSICPQAELR